MTNQEFSDSIDVMLNSYNTKAQFGDTNSVRDVVLDEYEKSFFLTKAQNDIVVNLYNGKNSYGDSFENTEELRRYLASLVSEKKLEPITNTSGIPLGISSNSKFFTLPEDLWFITLEKVTVSDSRCSSRNTIKVYPTKQDEYQSIIDNPFRGANSRRALRLDLSEGNVEIISKYQVTEYYIRYVKKLSPIILEDLPDNLSIEGITAKTECKLHEALHQKILERAIILALQSKGYNTTKS